MGYEVIEAKDGNEAWDVLRSAGAPSSRFSIGMMPGLSGPEICRGARAAAGRATYFIILSNLDATPTSSAPCNRERMTSFTSRSTANTAGSPQRGAPHRQPATSQTVVFTLARAVEARSPYTQGHADRVTHYALALAGDIGIRSRSQHLAQRPCCTISARSAFPTPSSTTGPLTREKYDVIKQHPELGVEILKPLQSLNNVLPLVRWHHEPSTDAAIRTGSPASRFRSWFASCRGGCL